MKKETPLTLPQLKTVWGKDWHFFACATPAKGLGKKIAKGVVQFVPSLWLGVDTHY
jgi:hypothetical protein